MKGKRHRPSFQNRVIKKACLTDSSYSESDHFLMAIILSLITNLMAIILDLKTF